MVSSDRVRIAERVVRTMLSRDAFSAWLGIELVEVGPERASVRMKVRDEMVNGFGVAHGGIVYSLADSALAFAANSDGEVTLTVENAASYPAPVKPGDVLTASAVERGRTSKLRFLEAEVRDQDGRQVGLVRGTVYRTGRPLLDEGAS